MKEILLTVYGVWVLDLSEFPPAHHLLEQWCDSEDILRNLTDFVVPDLLTLTKYRNGMPENEVMDSIINISYIPSMCYMN